MIVVDTTIVNVALPTLARDLRPGPAGLQWIVDSYTLSFTAALLPAGSLGDRFGRRGSLAAGLGVFGAGSLGAAAAHSSGQLIVMRTVMGLGAAFIMPATLSILTNVFTDASERAKAIGLWAAVSGLGIALGPTAGGWLLEHFSWSSIFLVNLPVVVLALAAGHWLIPALPPTTVTRLDPAGAVLAAAGLADLTYTLIAAPVSGWVSMSTTVRALAATALLCAFVAVELRSDHPMVRLTLFRDARFAAASSSVMMMFFGLTGMTYLLTQIYQFVLGYTALGAGLRALPSAAALTLSSPLAGRVARRVGVRLTVAGGLSVMTAGLAYLSTATPGWGYGRYLLATVTISAGLGLGMAPATNAVMASLPGPMMGVGSAMNNATRNLGSVLGVAIVGSVAASRYSSSIARSRLLSAPDQHTAAQSLSAAVALAHMIGGRTGNTVARVAARAFLYSADCGVRIAALATAAGIWLALRWLPRDPDRGAR